MESFKQYGIEIPYRRQHGQVKCVCPECVAKGQRSHPNDKSLSVNLDSGEWLCHYCGFKGRLKNRSAEDFNNKPKKEYRRPTPKPLTDLSSEIVDYFNSRGISQSTLKKCRIGEDVRTLQGERRRCISFNYYMEGELINIKSRSRDKKFMMEAGAELIPYNIDSIAGKDWCIITEGEIDCLSFVEVGLDSCVSVPNGANKNCSWLDDFVDGWFDDKETIYIASDMDSKGEQLRDELIRRMGAERCRIITYGAGCKDANEHLVKFGKESLEKCFRSSREVPVEGVYNVRDYENELDNIYLHGLQKGHTVGLGTFDSLISFETKRLCVVTGIPGSGKSELLDEITVRLNTMCDMKAAFFSPENMPLAIHGMKIIEKLTGKRLSHNSDDDYCIKKNEYEDAKDYMAENFFHILPEDSYTIEKILEKARYLVRKHGIRTLVIDPFNRIESEQSSKESETQYISRVLDTLTNFAQQQDVLVFLMVHPRKINKEVNGGIPSAYDINGSANFFNKADFLMVVHRDRERGHTLVRVEKVKFRHLGATGDAFFKFNTVNGRFVNIANPDDNPIYDCSSLIQARERRILEEANKTIHEDSGMASVIRDASSITVQTPPSARNVMDWRYMTPPASPDPFGTPRPSDDFIVDDKDLPF